MTPSRRFRLLALAAALLSLAQRGRGIAVGQRLPDLPETEACGAIKDYVAVGSARYNEMRQLPVRVCA